MTLEEQWRSKTDEEVFEAAKRLAEYNADAQSIILGEVERRSSPGQKAEQEAQNKHLRRAAQQHERLREAEQAAQHQQRLRRPEPPSAPRAAGASPVVDRYRDAYRIAASVVWIGGLVKVVGAMIFVLLGVVGGTELGGAMKLAAILLAVVAGLAFWLAGVFISALGQLVLATLDTAVHSSPFLTDDQRAFAMSVAVQSSPVRAGA